MSHFIKSCLPAAFLLCLGAFSLRGQGTADPNNTIGNVKIASPNAASLGKFVDIPVNYYTGVPGISIPIYTAKSGSLQLPVGLSYHAAGLRVQEQSSWVGAGWALEAGGVITRTVRGLPDEKQTASLAQDYGYFSDYGYFNYLFKDPSGNNSSLSEDILFINGNYDGEPDLFTFNFNGHSGKFYLNDDRSAFLVPQQDLKIDYQYTPGIWTSAPGLYNNMGRCIDGFTITTNDGTRYYFGKQVTAPVSPYVDPIEVTYPYSLKGGVSYGRSISSWFLNKVVSPDSAYAITLNYVPDNYAYYTVNTGNMALTPNYDLVKNMMYGVRLSQINFTNGNIDFVPGAVRQDLCDQGQNGTINDAVNLSSPALGAINIYSTETANFCKKFSLYYSYFTDNTTALPSNFPAPVINTDKMRLRLDSVQESSCSSAVANMPYKFQYYPETPPRYLSFDMDHWGYYNYNGTTHNTDLLPPLTLNNTASGIGTANRDSYWPAMRAGSINVVTFPTGGTATYNFEANTFYVQGADKTVGGMRIKTITESPNIAGQPPVVTNYSYLDYNNYSSSILYSVPTYIQVIRNDLLQNIKLFNNNGCLSIGNGSGQPYTYSPASVRPMETTQGYHLGYSRVVVTQSGNGSSEYRYYGTDPAQINREYVALTNANNSSCNDSTPNYPAAPLPYDFMRGELKYEGHYNQAGQILDEKEYYPVYQQSPVTVPGCIYFVNSTYNANLFSPYDIITGSKASNTIIHRAYGALGLSPVVDTSKQFFASPYHLQPTDIITTNSLGQPVEKRIVYAADFVVGAIKSLPVCSQTTYTNTVNSLTQSSYQSQFSTCLGGGDPSACIGGVYQTYLASVVSARSSYVSCRRTNYTDPGNAYQTAHYTAKLNADILLKPILWMQDINMNSPIETSAWKSNFLTGSSWTQYSNERNDSLGIYPIKTQVVELAAPSPSFTAIGVSTGNTSVTKDSRYTDLSSYNFNRGNVIKVLGRDGQPVSYDWAYSQSMPVVKISNASNTLRDSSQPAVLTNGFNFQLGPGFTTNSSSAAFTQVQSGNITLTASTTLPPGSNVTISYTVTGPTNKSGTLCAAGTGGASCGATPSSIVLTGMAPGSYTLAYTANTSFGSFVFSYNLSYSYWGMGILPTGSKEFFYDGFEENTASQVTTGASHTGLKYWNANYTTAYTPPNGRSYLIQWWNLAGGKWVYNQQAYTAGMALTGPVDDVRIFPADAMISTYTYFPAIIGLASETGPNGKTLYYSYDALGRLRMIKDQDGNVVKTIQYHYQNQGGIAY